MTEQAFTGENAEFLHSLCADYQIHNSLTEEAKNNSNIKRGLRNDDGTGVMIGCTKVGNVLGYRMVDGEREPMEGRLIYRGYDLTDLVEGYRREGRFGFAEIAYLLLFGNLPTPERYEMFCSLLHDCTALPENFTEDMILKNPSHDIMNKLGRSVLALYSSDPEPDGLSVENMMRQSIELVARFPVIVAHAYVVKRHYFENDSLYLHRPEPGLSTAENFLRMIRPNKHFTEEEARLLDLCLVCHAEHGGGNNSTFATRVLTSSGTDTYSAIAAGIGALKGPKHGGANIKVAQMVDFIRNDVADINDEGQVADYLRKIIQKEGGDRSGLIYGMGHAVYTISDPRAKILREQAGKFAAGTEFEEEFHLLNSIEKLTPAIFAEFKGERKNICANVDLYSGLVYKMLRIPPDLFTPIFTVARVAGWSAHRIEELLTGGRIIRPAYKNINTAGLYVPITER